MHFFFVIPFARMPSVPAFGILHLSLFVYLLALFQYGFVFTPMTLTRGDKLNATVPMFFIVPIDKLLKVFPCLLDIGKSSWVMWRVFGGAKPGFTVGIVITDA